MTREEPELLTDIRDFTGLFYVILRGKSSESVRAGAIIRDGVKERRPLRWLEIVFIFPRLVLQILF